MSAELSINEAKSQIEALLAKSTEDTDSPSPDEDSERTTEDQRNVADLQAEDATTTDQDEDVTDDDELEAQAGDEDDADGEAASEDEASIDSIEALAAEFEVEPDEILEGIGIDDGWGNVVPLGEALNGFRESRNQNLELQQQYEEKFQERVAAVDQQTESEIAKIAGLAQAMVQEMTAEFENVDLAELKARDPLQYADMIEKRQRRAELIKAAVSTMDFNAGLRQERSGATVEQVHQREAGLLRQKMPHWFKDQKTIQEVVKQNTDYMRSLGFDDASIAAVTDHRHIIALNEAAKWRASQKKAKGKTLEALRKQKGLRKPNLAKRATARVDQGDPNVTVRKDRMKHFGKSRSVKDAGKLLETFFTKN